MAKLFPINITINALRIDKNKVSAGLFSQFEEQCLLKVIGWPAVLYDESIDEEKCYIDEFIIIGRHSYKVTPEDMKQTPFLFLVNNEIFKSSLQVLLDNGQNHLESLKTGYQKPIERLNHCLGLVKQDPIKGIEMLSKYDLLGYLYTDEAFYDWQPVFMDDNDLVPVAFNAIQKKVLKDYAEASSRLDVSAWNESAENIASKQSEKQKSIKLLENSIKDTKTVELVVQWFTFNEELLKEELGCAEALYQQYDDHLSQLKQQILSSPKVYVGV
jgi:hypothetical protein